MDKKNSLLAKFLESEVEKTTDDLKEINAQLNKLSKVPDDEFALDGNIEVGRDNKKSIIEGLKFQKALHSGILSQIERFQNIVQLSDAEIESLNDKLESVRLENKSRFENMKLEMNENIMEQNSNFHVEWCELNGTQEPWAISEKCTCPGAYIIRKRMSEGMSFEEAKQYIINNESI